MYSGNHQPCFDVLLLYEVDQLVSPLVYFKCLAEEVPYSRQAIGFSHGFGLWRWSWHVSCVVQVASK